MERYPCRRDHLYIDKCRDNDEQYWVFEQTTSDEALIRAAGMDLCLETRGEEVALRPCDANNVRQNWFAVRGGFDQYRFEIGQKINPQMCLNQAHHPKAAEVLWMYPCARTRLPTHLTSWYELY